MKSQKKSPPYLKKIGIAVKVQRETRGISQEKLAELADCHRNYVSLVERGEQNLTVGNLVRIARALNCKTSILLAKAGV